MKKKLLKHGITGFACLGIVVLCCGLRGYTQLSMGEKYRALCDGFTIPGVLALCLGSLLWVSGDGFFNGLGYCLQMTWRALLPFGRRPVERYGEYVQRRRQKPVTGFSFLFVWGGVCMAIAVVFLLCFYRAG